jgi:hypothetical protein
MRIFLTKKSRVCCNLNLVHAPVRKNEKTQSGIEFTRRRAGEYRIVVFPRIPGIATVDKAPTAKKN